MLTQGNKSTKQCTMGSRSRGAKAHAPVLRFVVDLL